MNFNALPLACSALLCASAAADVWPHADGSMKHVMVSLSGQAISAHVEGDPLERIGLIRYPGEEYTPPADVLDGMYYASRYGWMADGFIDLPAGAGVFVSVIDADPGLLTYEGGMRSMLHTHTFAPILGTGGHTEPWSWNGTMVHNWYAAQDLGSYDAEYGVYVGDLATGEPLAGYTPGRVALHFEAVPAPGALALVGAASMGLLRRRREVGR